MTSKWIMALVVLLVLLTFGIGAASGFAAGRRTAPTPVAVVDHTPTFVEVMAAFDKSNAVMATACPYGHYELKVHPTDGPSATCDRPPMLLPKAKVPAAVSTPPRLVEANP